MYGLSGVPGKDTISKEEAVRTIGKYQDAVSATFDKLKEEIENFPLGEIPALYVAMLVKTAYSRLFTMPETEDQE